MGMGKQTDTEHRALPGKRKRSQKLIDRDLKAFELSLAGLSIRAIGEELGIKSTQTVWGSVQRGKEYVIEHGIDLEARKVEIDQLFKRTLSALAAEVEEQRREGRVIQVVRNDGFREVKKIKGVDPRTAEALARSADRWAQFLGVTDRGVEQTNQAITMVNLAAPSDGASFSDKWSTAPVEKGGEVVDVSVAGDAGATGGKELPEAKDQG